VRDKAHAPFLSWKCVILLVCFFASLPAYLTAGLPACRVAFHRCLQACPCNGPFPSGAADISKLCSYAWSCTLWLWHAVMRIAARQAARERYEAMQMTQLGRGRIVLRFRNADPGGPHALMRPGIV